jgi:hypothetical protein
MSSGRRIERVCDRLAYGGSDSVDLGWRESREDHEDFDLVGGDVGGVADALHGEVEPSTGDEVEAGVAGDFGLVGVDEVMDLVLAVEGDVPGVEAGSDLPAWSPPGAVPGGSGDRTVRATEAEVGRSR